MESRKIELSRALADCLDISEYVIQTSKLHASMLSGQIEMQDLQLKVRDIPSTALCVKGGSVRRLSIKVPWKHLKTKSTEVVVDDIHVILGTRTVPAGERGAQHEAAVWAKQEVVGRVLGSVKEKGRIASMMETVVDNLVVNINNLTVVLDFDGSGGGGSGSGSGGTGPFFAKLFCESLRFNSCDKDWQSVFIGKSAVDMDAIVRKLCVTKGKTGAAEE